jgi:hypothetical protein
MQAPYLPERLPEIRHGLKIYAFRPMLGHLSSQAEDTRCVAVGAGVTPLGQQIPQSHATARFAAPDADLVAPRQRQQQEPSMLERDAYRAVKF